MVRDGVVVFYNLLAAAVLEVPFVNNVGIRNGTLVRLQNRSCGKGDIFGLVVRRVPAEVYISGLSFGDDSLWTGISDMDLIILAS